MLNERPLHCVESVAACHSREQPMSTKEKRDVFGVQIDLGERHSLKKGFLTSMYVLFSF